ncbi:MAG: hypothetical protein EOS65_10855 [Mesorhizobium sp.]|uniref:hypothetical protein n=1 Tax=Mesorhizobium sp. TaxID=1871066 RepID=UPI000FE705ED|nr:hypothetical protein [Mesorhizobium sp.]RWF41834.1 MAG: hypothetical protein EOS65_10855 [Mesorhizobium sp.]
MLTDKIREDRVRRSLAKDGYCLKKTPARSWRREHYGVGYMIFQTDRNIGVSGYSPQPYSDTLEDVEAFAFGKASS